MPNDRPAALDLAEEIVKYLVQEKKMIAAAESCTAGLVADLIGSVPGASSVFWGSFVAYTADAKYRMLGVPGELIEKYGAVSRPIALAMAEGALEKSGAFWAFSVTGLAGPGGDANSGLPIGTVWIGIAGRDGGPEAVEFRFSGSRDEVRQAAAAAALNKLWDRINSY